MNEFIQNLDIIETEEILDYVLITTFKIKIPTSETQTKELYNNFIKKTNIVLFMIIPFGIDNDFYKYMITREKTFEELIDNYKTFFNTNIDSLYKINSDEIKNFDYEIKVIPGRDNITTDENTGNDVYEELQKRLDALRKEDDSTGNDEDLSQQKQELEARFANLMKKGGTRKRRPPRRLRRTRRKTT